MRPTSGLRWLPRPSKNVPVTRTGCCPRTAPAQTRPLFRSGSLHRRAALPMRSACWPRELPRRERESYRPGGSNGIHPKGDRTLSIITHAPPPGWIPVASSTFVCTADRITTTAAFSSNLYPSLDPCLQDGKCVSLTPPECISSTTTPRPQPGTTRDCLPRSTRTYRNTSVISVAS